MLQLLSFYFFYKSLLSLHILSCCFFRSVNLLAFLMLCSVLSSDFLHNGHLVSVLSPLWLQLTCHIITSFFVSLSHSCICSSPSYPLLLAFVLFIISCFVLPSMDLPIFFFQLLFSFGFTHALHIFYFHSYFLCNLLYFLDHGILVVAFCLFC